MNASGSTHPRASAAAGTAPRTGSAVGVAEAGECRCCPRYHEAVELVGKRWTGAILYVLMQGGRLRFTEIAQAVPDLSDRLLSERMKELEGRGIVDRRVEGAPTRVSYALTERGRQLAPALAELKTWADRWLR